MIYALETADSFNSQYVFGVPNHTNYTLISFGITTSRARINICKVSCLLYTSFVYGLDSNTYWELVRKNSIKYWLNMDRNEIFDIEVIK